MFKNMKLGTKIGVGFGLLIAIAVILGLVAVVSMKGVEGDSLKLSEEYAPEALLASELERRVYRTMYAIRGYGYTGQKQFLDDGLAAIAQVKETMGRLEALADRAVHLVRLRESLGEAKRSIAEYENLVVESEKALVELGKIAETMQANATQSMQTADALIKNQNAAMVREIQHGASNAELNERLNKITLINNLIDQGNLARIANLRARANRNNQIMEEGIRTVFPEIERNAQEADKITRLEEDKRALREVLTAAHNYKAAMQRYLDVSLELDKLNTARVVTGEKALSVARDLMRAAGDETAHIATEASASLNRAATAVIIGLVLALIVGILLAYFIARSITKPINRIIQGLNDGAEQVASASTQVSSASQSLAEGASEQAAAIEETSSSLEEMSSMTKQNAENANQARTKMAEAREIVSKVNRHMDDMSAAIKEITKSSEETGKIIKTIDEIAFQTNLLALNAAVEAARAGEAGAGFAVVADEVRNLAMRAADAAKNTADLIEKTIKSVKTGNDLTEATQEAYQANVEISAKVGELVDEIAAASEEQAQGIDQINKAVTEMDKVTQQNAANAEESASASEEMNAQADEMQAMVQELVQMVGGAAAATHTASRVRPRKQAHGRKPMAPARTKALTVGAAGKAGPPAPAKQREVRPEQVIPFGDDELKNF